MSEMSVSRKYRKRSHAAEIWRNFRKNKGAMLGLFILLIIFAIALTIEFWIDKDLVIGQHVAQRLKPPSWQHLFGTDDKGREMFWRVLYAERTTSAVAAQIMVEETERMISQVKGLFYALVAHGKIQCDDVDMAALSFAMAVHSLVDYQMDRIVAHGLTSADTSDGFDDVKDYIAWFARQMEVEHA